MESQSQINKAIFITVFAFVALSTVIGGGLYMSKQKQSPAKSSASSLLSPTVTPGGLTLPSPVPTVMTAASIPPLPQEKTSAPITDNTVSFTRDGRLINLRYRGKIYDDSDQTNPKVVELENPDGRQWVGLVSSPPDVSAGEPLYDEVFGFKIAPDRKGFIFIMRWGIKENPETLSYYVYHYDYGKENQPKLVKKYTPSVDKGMSVPKIEDFSSDGKYVSFNMFSCWDCGGHPPEKLLVRLEDYKTKNIGKTSAFTWKENGAYEYKEYKVIPCEGESSGECSEKPENMPAKDGTFE